MRIQFAGPIIRLQPVVLIWTADTSFSKQQYIDAGYTNFDVICIGGGGGKGGGADGDDTNQPGIHLKSFGGEGGGGGLHRVRGLLAALDADTFVIVGGAGAAGTDGVGSTALTANTDGSDGGPSQFGILVAASGGKGGLKVFTLSQTESPGSDGGEGGVGEATAAGGGALGGVAGTLGPFSSGIAGANGTFIGGIGQGGGGGAGGVGKYTGITQLPATVGGRGSYNAGDESVFGPAGGTSNDPASQAAGVIPGKASGARITPLNGSNTVYGQSGMPGVVAIRLSSE